MPMNIEKWEREALYPDEADELLKHSRNSKELVILTFLIDTGCRKNEMINLRVNWIRWDEDAYGVIRIPVRPDYVPLYPDDLERQRGPKTKKPRRIQMTKRLSELLHEWFAHHEHIGVSSGHVNVICLRCAEDAGITRTRVTPHVLRHTFVTQAFYKGHIDPEEIGQAVGHSSGAMVRDVYLHIDEMRRRDKIRESGWLDR